ncbi:MAG: DUF2997 domain-containing protein [Chloroflexota bacterium]|nr:DUF2997 domain-containing protein [Chloroflexota bacterium]
MREIEFSIDTATGQLEMHIKGISGPACDDIAKLTKELLGEPGREEATAEYHLPSRVLPQVRPKAGR